MAQVRIEGTVTLLDVYGDGLPPDLYLVVGDGLQDALVEWNQLDYMFVDGDVQEGDGPDDWRPVNVWLQSRGFQVFPIADQIKYLHLDDCDYGGEEEEDRVGGGALPEQ